MTQLPRFLYFVTALGLLAGCDGTDPIGAEDVSASDLSGPPSLQRVTTTLSADSILAGETAEVTCQGIDQYGDPIEVALGIRVIDAGGNTPEGLTVDGTTIQANFAGAYRVICHHLGTPALSDTAPPTLAVQAGPPAEIVTFLLFETVTAGTRLSVGCSVRDASGNRTAAEVELKVSPTEGTFVEGGAVRFEKTGTYSVSCALTDGSLESAAPRTVTVTPDALFVLDTVLSRDTISPGEQVTVTCPGRDRFGNAVELTRVITAPVPGLTAVDAQRLELTGTTAGLYAITCVPQEAWVKASTSPAQLEVLPGDPVSLTLTLSPDRAVYALGQRVLVTPELRDAWDNPITGLSDSVFVTASFGGTIRQTLTPGSRATLNEEGTWTLRAQLDAPWNLSAQRSVIADASAPVIDIVSPARGEMVTATGSSMALTGEIRDTTGGLESVFINGADQQVAVGTQIFPVNRTFPPRHGVNTNTFEATDVTGLFSRAVQSFLAAPEWKAASQPFDAGIVAFLSRDFIDDGDRSGAANDLGTIFERALASMDVSSFLPSPVVTYSGYDVYLRNMRHSSPDITLTPGNAGLSMRLNVRNVSVDVFADGFINVTGTVLANEIDVDMLLSIGVTNGNPRVVAETSTVNINGLRINVHWSINWLVNLFSTRIENALGDALSTQIAQMIPPMLRDMLRSIEINETFTVPAFFPGMSPLNIALSGRLHSANVTEAGIRIGLRTRASAARRVNWATRGSMMRGGCFGVDLGEPPWNPARRLGAAVTHDVLNQTLHALWQGGGLQFSMGASAFSGVDLSNFGIGDLSIDVSGRLPPVLTDCRGALTLQMAELHMDVRMTMGGMPLNLSLIVALETGANVSLDGGSLSLVLDPIDPEAILVDIVDVESELFDANMEVELIEVLRTMVLTRALDEIGGQALADFPLPEIDLGALDPSMSGTVISFSDSLLINRHGFLTLAADP